MAAMVLRSALVVTLPLLWLVPSACTPDKKPAPAAATQEPEQPKLDLPPLRPPERCNLEVELAGPLRRAGLAQVALEGSGGKILGKDAPALCGPMFNKDSPQMGIVAGTGVLFEACLPQGLLQVSSFERTAGEQPLRSLTQAAGAEVAFNMFEGGTFSSRGMAGDRVAFGADFWSAEVAVTLKNERDTEELQGTVRFACPIPNPHTEKDGGSAPN
jgi:hypothetical protein